MEIQYTEQDSENVKTEGIDESIETKASGVSGRES